jgi:hypothetical protein
MVSVLPSGRSWLSSMRVKPKNIKLVFTAFPPSTEHYGIRAKTGWLRKRIMSPSGVDQIPSSVHRHPQTGQVHFKPLTKLFAPWNPQQQANVQSSVTSGTLYIQMYSWDNMQPLHTWKQTYDVSFLNCDCCFSV